MSFRYTNSLIGVLKHRMLLECSYREIATRTFIGYCRGVEVVCSGYGSVLKVRLTEKEMWEPFYRNSAVYSNSEPLADKAEGESETASPMTGAASTGPLDLERLSESVRAALWDATRKIRSAKEAALHRSLSHNPQLQATAELKHWYEEDANTLRPLAFEALKHEAATPWMRLIQFGKLKEAASLLKNQRQGGASSSSQGVVNNGEKQQLQSTEGADVHAPLKDTLTVADLHPSTIPIGSVHPLFTPALIQMEDSQTGAVNDDAVRRAQLWELSRDEQYFWERVELIRKGQIASIGSVHKRGYADEALSAKDNAEEKVQLRFTQSTVRHLVEICETCVPNNFVHATDVAFYFPRFQPRLHLPDCRIPEIRDAIELLQPLGKATPRRWSSPLPLSALALAEWKKNRDRALTLLSRGEEIMKNIGGARCAAAADVIRPLYATVFELINGLEHLPRSDFATRMDVHRFIVKHAGCLLYFNDSWDRSDVRHLDTACVVVAHFIRSFCALHQRPFHIKQTESSKNQNNKLPSSWTMSVEGGESSDDVLNLKMVADRLDELLQLSKEMAEKHLVESPELRWNVPKLLLLKGILSIPLTGNLTLAQNLVDSAAKTVYEFTRRKMPIVDGIVARKQEHELGLFMLSQAEMAARVFDWSIAPGEVDMEVIEMFESAAKFYSSPCNTALNADGIMSAEDLHQRRFEADAYSSCMLSYANFLLGAPRPQGTSRRDAPVFLPKQMFSTSPIATVATSSDIIYTDVRRPQAMAVEVTRKKAGEALERGLQLNRDLYPERKLNPKAGWTLVAMASLYADMRDYLYATGLFASAEKTIIENYGSVSLERLVVSKLRYEFLAGVGSEDEAKASTHEIVQLLKQMDAMPHR